MSKGLTVNISIMRCITVLNCMIARHYQRKRMLIPLLLVSSNSPWREQLLAILDGCLLVLVHFGIIFG